MQLHILITPELYPIPDNIIIDHEWGNLTIVTRNEGETPDFIGGERVTGLHAFVSGEKEAIVDWLGKHDGFWKGSGSPMMESFKICHVKEELVNATKEETEGS